MRVLQITDCHLLPEVGATIYGADTFRSLSRVLQSALALPERPDLVVATGDLSEDGSDASYKRLRQVLLLAGLPVYVIAGNHDSVEAMRRALIGGPICMEPCLDVGAWRVVFLNSKVAGASYGYLEQAELRRLAETLSADWERPAVICLHHSPIRPCPSTGCHLKNDDELIATLDSHPNARAVLAGHSHVELKRRVQHATLLTTPATSSQCVHAQTDESVDHEDFWSSHRFDASRHGFRMLSLDRDGRFKSSVHWISNDQAVA
jgi:3',5'-cyclic-AMP phosphodiesterase